MDNNKKPTSTQKIRDLLKTQSEGALPDHLLPPDSAEKRKRVSNMTYMMLLNQRLHELDMEIMIRQAQIQYAENEAYYKNLQRLENLRNYFNDLLYRILSAKKRAQALLEEHLNSFKVLLYNFEIVIDALKKSSLEITANVGKLREEVTELKDRLPEISNQIDRSADDVEVKQLTQDYELIQAQINAKEKLIERLELKLVELDRYLDAIAAAAEVTLSVMEEKRCDPAEFKALLEKGKDLIQDAILTCDLQSVQPIKLMDDPFSLEDSAPKLR